MRLRGPNGERQAQRPSDQFLIMRTGDCAHPRPWSEYALCHFRKRFIWLRFFRGKRLAIGILVLPVDGGGQSLVVHRLCRRRADARLALAFVVIECTPPGPRSIVCSSRTSPQSSQMISLSSPLVTRFSDSHSGQDCVSVSSSLSEARSCSFSRCRFRRTIYSILANCCSTI